jgi:hypothetical protein
MAVPLTPGCALEEGTGGTVGEGTVWEGVHAANASKAIRASRSTPLVTHDGYDGSFYRAAAGSSACSSCAAITFCAMCDGHSS